MKHLVIEITENGMQSEESCQAVHKYMKSPVANWRSTITEPVIRMQRRFLITLRIT